MRKHGEDDSVIPANVVEVINFYQPNGILHGSRESKPRIRLAPQSWAIIVWLMSVSRCVSCISLVQPTSVQGAYPY